MRVSPLFAVAVFACGCNGLIGDVSVDSSDPTVDEAPVDASALEALAEKCAEDSAPGSAWTDLHRLSTDELLSTFTDLVGDDVLKNVEEYVGQLPDDTRTAAALGSATYTSAHVESIVLLAAALGEQIAASKTFRTRIIGTCAATTANTACIEAFIRSFGARAFRRPLSDDEVTQLMTDYASAAKTEDRLPVLIMQLLVSPQLVFHIETGVDGSLSRTHLTPYEIASRISYQAIGSMPDEALFAAAADGALTTVAEVRAQVVRLLATDRGRERTRDFTRYWLQLDAVPQPSMQASTRRGLDPDELRADAVGETFDFVDYSLWQTKGTIRDLAESTVAFPRTAGLAAIYGTTPWDGSSAPPVSPTHRGLFSRVSALLAPSDLTSPIMRSVNLRERMLCERLPAPDFSIISTRTDALGEISREEYSTREAVTMLTSPDNCYGCHQSINPAGFVLENFGALGEWRTEEIVYSDDGVELARHPIDTAVDDLKLASIPYSASTLGELVDFVSSRESLDTCTAQHMVEYVNTRSLSSGDYCSAYAVARASHDGGTLLDAFADAIAKEDIFWRGQL